jgi:hypothetical protein
MAVQIVCSSRRGSRDIEHVGSADEDAGLEVLKAAARNVWPDAAAGRYGWWKRLTKDSASHGRRPQASIRPRRISGHCDRRL